MSAAALSLARKSWKKYYYSENHEADVESSGGRPMKLPCLAGRHIWRRNRHFLLILLQQMPIMPLFSGVTLAFLESSPWLFGASEWNGLWTADFAKCALNATHGRIHPTSDWNGLWTADSARCGLSGLVRAHLAELTLMAHLAESTVQLFLCEMGVLTHSQNWCRKSPPPVFLNWRNFAKKRNSIFKVQNWCGFLRFSHCQNLILILKDNLPECSTLGVQEGSQSIEGHLKLYPFLLSPPHFIAKFG